MAREKGTGSLQREKSGRWTLRVSIDGKRFSRSTKTTDRRKAEDYLNRFLAPFGLGKKTLPLAKVWGEYEKSPNRRDLSVATMQAKRKTWMRFASWVEDNHVEITELKHLTSDVVAEYLMHVKANHSAGTYNNRVCILREICRTVADKGGITENPWAAVRLLPDDCHSRREFSPEELRRIVYAARRLGREWEMLFLIAMYTGLRLGDCCCLSWSSVDLQRGIIQLIPQKTHSTHAVDQLQFRYILLSLRISRICGRVILDAKVPLMCSLLWQLGILKNTGSLTMVLPRCLELPV